MIFGDIIDWARTWWFSPPIWLSSSAIIVMTGAFLLDLWWKGSLRNVFRFIFRRSYREAEFVKIVSDEAVSAYKQGLLAADMLKTNQFEHLSSPIPPSTEPSPANNTGDAYGELLSEWSRRIRDYALFAIALPINGKSEEFSKRIEARMSAARTRAYAERAGWADAEKGGHFESDWARNRFHELRYETAEMNSIIDALKAQLKAKTNSWQHIIDEETRSRLLEDISKGI